jgi:hypothetical protein
MMQSVAKGDDCMRCKSHLHLYDENPKSSALTVTQIKAECDEVAKHFTLKDATQLCTATVTARAQFWHDWTAAHGGKHM